MKLTRIGAAFLAVALFAGCDQLNKKDEKKEEKPAAQSTAGSQPAQPAVDMTAYMTVPSPMTGWPKGGEGVKQGFWVSQKITSNAGGTSTVNETKYSVVVLAGDAAKVEVSAPPAYKDYIEALAVTKSSGEVTWAGAGHKGEKPKDIKIQKAPAGTAAAPAATDEDVSVKAGTFKSKKTVMKTAMGDSTTWVGTDGETAGIMLKNTFGSNSYELAEAPKTEDMAVAGQTLKVKHVKYTNGQEFWYLPESWPFVFNIAKMSGMGTTMEITGTGTDAKPELNWEGH